MKMEWQKTAMDGKKLAEKPSVVFFRSRDSNLDIVNLLPLAERVNLHIGGQQGMGKKKRSLGSHAIKLVFILMNHQPSSDDLPQQE